MSNCHGTLKYVFSLFFCIILSSCTGLTSAQPLTQTAQPSRQLTPEINPPTLIPATPEPSPTHTPTEKPTITPTLISLPFEMPTFDTNVEGSEENAQIMLAEESRKTQIATFSITCEDFNKGDTSLSPKGNWLAISCGYERDQTLQINSKTGKKWVLSFKDYVTKQDLMYGVPLGGLYPEHWTSDEKYLYFASYIGFDGGGTCVYDGAGDQGLFRFNIDNGNVSRTLPLISGADGYFFSFSPAGGWLAYYRRIPTILKLQTGEEIILQEGEKSVGDFVWSPDGSNLAYSTCQPSEDYSTIKKSSIRIFSLKTRETKTVLEVDRGFLRIESGDENELKIYDANTNQRDYQYFAWSSERLMAPTLTPTP